MIRNKMLKYNGYNIDKMKKRSYEMRIESNKIK